MRKIGPKQIDTNLIPRHRRGFKLLFAGTTPFCSISSSVHLKVPSFLLRHGRAMWVKEFLIFFLFSLVLHSRHYQEKEQAGEGIQHQQPQIGLFVSIAKGEIIRFLNYSSRYHLDYLTDGRGSGCGCGCASPRELICFHSSTFNATLCRRRENKIPPRKGLCLSCLKFMLMMCQ